MLNKTITKKNASIIVYVITALMLSASFIYFVVALQDYKEILQANPSDSKDASDIAATKNEMSFFLVVGIAYIPVAIWMLKIKHKNKVPYIIAIIGSIALILLYALTRTVNLPSIGLQSDIGMIDIAAKVIQGGIVSISIFLIYMVNE